MKDQLIGFLQRVLGYERYLVLFSVVRIWLLRFDPVKSDYLWFVNSLDVERKTVVVAGACTGITTVPYARKIKDGAIHAFEADASNTTALVRVCQFFGIKNVYASQTALGNCKGVVSFKTPIINGALKQGLGHVDDPDIEGFSSFKERSVNVQKLDDILELQQGFNVLQLVVENYELKVLLGAEQLLRKFHPIIYCELWNTPQRKKVVEFLRSIGYTAVVRTNGSLIHLDLDIHRNRAIIFKYEI